MMFPSLTRSPQPAVVLQLQLRISKFAVSSALPRVRSPPGCPGRRPDEQG